MANTKSALKRVRQAGRRTDRNRTLRSRVKTLRRKTVEAAEAGRREEAEANLRALFSAVDRAQKNNVFHRNRAANLKSRASKVVKAAVAS